jgi:phage shock protein C
MTTATTPAITTEASDAEQPSVLARDHTILGVCEGLGEDFGFNPIYLRIALCPLLLWNPLAAFGVYAALGMVVLFSRLLVRERRPAAAPAEAAAATAATAATAPVGSNDSLAEVLAAAA